MRFAPRHDSGYSLSRTRVRGRRFLSDYYLGEMKTEVKGQWLRITRTVVKSHDSGNRLPLRKGIERSDGGMRSEVGREGKGERVGMVIRWYQRIKKVESVDCWMVRIGLESPGLLTFRLTREA